MKKRPLYLWLALGLFCCGDPSPMFIVQITRTPTSPTPLATLKQLGGRIYFNFEKLNSADLNDFANPRETVVFPERASDAFDPQADSFDVGGAPVNPNAWYKVTMIGATASSDPNDPPYRSVPSCAWKKALGNGVMLCFGAKSDVVGKSCSAPTPCPTQ